MSVRGNQFLAGLFILVGLFLFALSIWILGKERQFFSSQQEYQVTFSDVKGLNEGAPVRLGGISIGRVSRIAFSKDLSDPRVHVTLAINDTFLDRIRIDSRAVISTQGLLGDKFVSISPGAEKKQLLPNETLKSEEPADISQVLESTSTIIENTKKVSENLNLLVEEIRTETIQSFSQSTKSIAAITKEIEEGQGSLHRLIYDKKQAEGLAKASTNLGKILEQIATGDGTLNKLIYGSGSDSASLSETMTHLNTATKGLAEIISEVKNGNGLLHELVYTTTPDGQASKLTAIIEKLSLTAENLSVASQALAQGTGTLGALLIDPKVYDNLIEVTDGAKRSFILRQAVRSSMNSSVEKE